MMETKEVFHRITDWLTSSGVSFRTLHHEATLTSEESARVRGEDISIGGKALVLKVGEVFHLFVMSAAKKLDSKALRKYFKVKKVRFASREELLELTGLVPGCVPPFGKPILDFDLFVDVSIRENNRIAFNAGSLTDSVVMTTEDYFKIANAEIITFTK